MKRLILITALFIITGTAQAQDGNEISINTSAEVLVPADKISFHINLNAESETPQEAYDLHKEREKVLVELLKKHDIKEENIDFEPISISKRYNNRYPNEEKRRIQTRQNVVITLDDFNIYEQIQITLIENGFDEFRGNFGSSESQQGEEEALKKALKTAREKAETIARETGVTISGIKNINFSYNQGPPRPMRMEAARAQSSDNLLEFDQTVNISASVSVTYNFTE